MYGSLLQTLLECASSGQDVYPTRMLAASILVGYTSSLAAQLPCASEREGDAGDSQRVTYVWLCVSGLAMTDGAAARPASGLVVFALAVNIMFFLAYTEARYQRSRAIHLMRSVALGVRRPLMWTVHEVIPLPFMTG